MTNRHISDMRRVNMSLPRSLVASMDRVAKSYGLPRSEIVRRLLQEALDTRAAKAKRAQAKTVG